MITPKDTVTHGNLYFRLVSLWVISEGLAGGIAHGLHLPFSGMFLAGFAVVCICLIGYYTRENISTPGRRFKKNTSILKAALIVCFFKMMISPYTPVTAYFAVIFQGFVGQLLFSNVKYFRLSCIILGFLALVETALQRILVLLLVYGVDFWHAVNDFLTKFSPQKSETDYTLFLALGYIFIHALFGILIGIWAARLIPKGRIWQAGNATFIIPTFVAEDVNALPGTQNKKRKIFKGIFIFIWIFLLLLFFQSVLHLGKPILPSYKALWILIRSVLIFLTWYFVLGPVLTRLLKKFLIDHKRKWSGDINRTLLFIPSVQHIFKNSWEKSNSLSGLSRLTLFWKIVLINVLEND